jgi:nucleoside-diphosphate-sugar epimerase
MRVMVTGANGFIGRALVSRLLANGSIRGQPIEALLLLDQTLNGFPEDIRLRRHVASINEAALLRRALADGADVVFHLAGIPDSTADTQYDRGYQVNLLGSLELMQQLRSLERPPVMVYTSCSAISGDDLAVRAEKPRQSCFQAHKHMVEIALADLSRRAEIDGRVVRLPTIVGHESDSPTFVSELLRAYARAEPYCCPVSAHTSLGLMSLRRCIDNVLHAAEIEDLGAQRVWQLPTLHASVTQVLDALETRFGAAPRTLITFASHAHSEDWLGRHSQVETRDARAQGFRHDGSAAALIRHALDAQKQK